jgi:hypothetical protein
MSAVYITSTGVTNGLRKSCNWWALMWSESVPNSRARRKNVPRITPLLPHCGFYGIVIPT